MTISVFDLFTIGIGPSSSHTVGPMRAAHRFLRVIQERGELYAIRSLTVELYGSLAATGKGHGTDMAILLGLEGETPERVNPDKIGERLARIRLTRKLSLMGRHPIRFVESEQLLYLRDQNLPHHPNGMRFCAEFENGEVRQRRLYSIGGGFISDPESIESGDIEEETRPDPPFPFHTGADLLRMSQVTGHSIAELMLKNEQTWRPDAVIRRQLMRIWEVMRNSIDRGCANDGVLPGGLNVKRRAPNLYRRLMSHARQQEHNPAELMDWISLYAIAVTEENAAGGRVVTAPTNGASGVIPAVIQYYLRFTKEPRDDAIIDFLLTAAAIAILFKKGASLSAAEVGCQGEVGVACSMASAGLAAAMGGTTLQIENAAEIGMEHNLGLTCDPVGGLVQIPCIERNTMGAIKAINAARLSLRGDGEHHITLDKVIATMRQTGRDMHAIYKETSEGGLAVSLPEC